MTSKLYPRYMCIFQLLNTTPFLLDVAVLTINDYLTLPDIKERGNIGCQEVLALQIL